MNQATKVFVGMLVVAAVLVVGFFLVGPKGDPVYLTPEEVFEAARKASLRDDIKSWCQCLTDESRDMFAVKMLLSVPPLGEAVDPKSPLGGLEAIFARHGFRPAFLANVRKQGPAVLRNPQTPLEEKAAFANAVLEPVGNRNQFVDDLVKAMMRIGLLKESPLDEWRESELAGRPIPSGSTAVGKLTIGGGPAEPVHFRKQGEGWRIDLMVEQGPPRMPMGHPPIR